MIQEINLENIDDIGPIIDQFKEKSPESGIPDNFLETIKEAVAADKAHTYGAFSENGELVGTALFGKTSQRISFV
ncbi:MAG: hypothetical protein ACFFDM_13395, partial [Candidatus Thorarchaeota archaeon]